MRRPIQSRLLAVLSMLGGSSLVFSVVLYMNQQEKPPREALERRTVEFQLAPPPPPKRKEKPEQQPRRPRRSADTAAPRAPDLSLAIAGVAIDFGGVSGGALAVRGGDLLGTIDTRAALTEGALDEPPRVRSRGGTQEYPARARREGIEGYVLLSILVRGDGTVGDVKVLDASPRGVFEQAARDYVRGFSFQPGVYQGAAADAWVKQRVVFKLQHS